MRKRARSLFAAVGLWFTASAMGLWSVADYALQALPAGPPSAVWPVDLEIRRTPGKPTLTMAIHPLCPCTRASLEELAVVRAAAGDRMAFAVLVAELEGVPARQALWNKAAAIPGVEVRTDPGGRFAQRLGARVSGHAFVYGPAGELLYSGGLTASRGHAGPNFGRDAAIQIARGAYPRLNGPPALGCALSSQTEGPSR